MWSASLGTRESNKQKRHSSREKQVIMILPNVTNIISAMLKFIFIENNSVIYSSWSVLQSSWTKAKLPRDTEYQTGKVVSNFYYHMK